MDIGSRLLMDVAASTVRQSELFGTPLWFYVVLILIFLAILVWAFMSRSWESTVAEREEAAAEEAARQEALAAEEAARARALAAEEAARRAEEAAREEAAAREAAAQEAAAQAAAAQAAAARAATVVLDEPAVPDNLEVIEGIGPKIARVLADAGITTFAQLAGTDVATLNQIVREDAGITIAFPDTWPRQAQYAVDGDMEGMARYQEELQAGRVDDD